MSLLPQLITTDILVGIPSRNEGTSIGYVTKMLAEGLKKHFPNHNALIVNIDNSTDDGETKKAFLGTHTEVGKLYMDCTSLHKDKGGCLHLLMELAKTFNARATVCVDADLKSITPDWVKALATPVIEGYDFVCASYMRHHLDGTITTNIVYPLVYGLLNKDLRQPIAGEFAFSLRMSNHWLSQDWEDSTYRFGVDNFMTVQALLGDFRTCQVSLGAKIHKPSAPKLEIMFSEVVTTLFSLLSSNAAVFEHTTPSDLPVFGDVRVAVAPVTLPTDLFESIMMRYWSKKKDFIRHVLAPARFREIEEQFVSGTININAALWTELVYTFLAYYARNKDVEVRTNVVESLKALYFARALTFAQETRNMTEEQAEAQIRHQARLFREQRRYFFDLLSHPLAIHR